MPARTPPEDAGSGDEEKYKGEADVEGAVAGEIAEERRDLFGARSEATDGSEIDVGDGPAGDHGIKRKDSDAAGDAESTHQPPARVRREFLERAHRTSLRASPEDELGL